VDAAYWDKLAHRYERCVLNAWDDSRTGLLRRIVRRHADTAAHAADFGCGTGHALALLSECFGSVAAYDFSRANLTAAKARHGDLENVRLLHRDLSTGRAVSPKVGFGVCVNVLIAPDADLRDGILRAVAGSLKMGARLLLVVPSLESALYVDRRLLDWNLVEGIPAQAARGETLPADAQFDLAGGIVPLDGVPTRHYLREELESTLPHFGLEPIRIRKVTYPWNTEFQNPPPFLQKPHPWDWAVLARKA
jgi:SAM-dependent methyltransferase